MENCVKLHIDIYDDLMKIEENDAYLEARELLDELEINPLLGEPLNDREDLGIFLAGYRKIYFYYKKYRIVYAINEDKKVEVISIFVVAIGKRNNLSVYKIADERLNI